jgi:hypothetical protein
MGEARTVQFTESEQSTWYIVSNVASGLAARRGRNDDRDTVPVRHGPCGVVRDRADRTSTTAPDVRAFRY